MRLRQAQAPAFIAHRKHRSSQIISKYRTVEENTERVMPTKNALAFDRLRLQQSLGQVGQNDTLSGEFIKV